MKKLRLLKTLGIISVLLLSFTFGCSLMSDQDDDLAKRGKGLVVFKLTDAPFPADLVAEANITIDWVKLMKVSENDTDVEGEGEPEENPDVILLELEEPVTFNLLELSNGITTTLGEIEVDPGVYTQIRMHVIDAGILLKDGSVFDLKIPGGDASGLKIKINPSLVMEEGTLAEVLLDFDVSRSFVMRGNINHLGKGKINGFIFKPVIRAVAHVQTESGEINGVVADVEENPIENALLSLVQEEDTITSARTDEKGFYAMIGILPGEYSLVCKKDALKAEVEVTVKKGEVSVENFVLKPEGDE
jgi:hypothetical protein